MSSPNSASTSKLTSKLTSSLTPERATEPASALAPVVPLPDSANPADPNLQCIPATIVPGHRVASGQGGDPRFPGGTLAAQEPVFRSLGLDLAAYYRGTLNLAIAPWRYQVGEPLYCFRSVRWHPTAPPEDFSFFDCRLFCQDQDIAALVYYPHPDTKPEHFQAPDVLEVLCPYVAGVRYGMAVAIEIDRRRIQFQLGGEAEALGASLQS